MTPNKKIRNYRNITPNKKINNYRILTPNNKNNNSSNNLNLKNYYDNN